MRAKTAVGIQTQPTTAPSPSPHATCAASLGHADHSSASQPTSDRDATLEPALDGHANVAGAGGWLSIRKVDERLFAEAGASLSGPGFREALQAFTSKPPIRAYYTQWRNRKRIPANALVSKLDSVLEELHAAEGSRGSNDVDAVHDPSFEELVSALGFAQPFDGERFNMLSAALHVAGAPSQAGTSASASGSSAQASSVAEEALYSEIHFAEKLNAI
eukprot:CAMPEP_0117545058 /NCGR_PEP_ID=MMETSP0784-20121206/45899_1 /TAXON_ID=39447 /ORGANISM="" /LENGTH=217 /DNA_ID=CAMNT_0005341893 /DNA_START=370 /DNA_END=1021 /DNA_ORIENTATION=+